jgi:transmembrane 9 superfamily protein 3
MFPQLKQFKDAIEDDFFFEMLIDDLPVWGYIGEVGGVCVCRSS